jgi:hypothetical protein
MRGMIGDLNDLERRPLFSQGTRRFQPLLSAGIQLQTFADSNVSGTINS